MLTEETTNRKALKTSRKGIFDLGPVGGVGHLQKRRGKERVLLKDFRL